jgi:hypothetical protein
MPRLKTPGLRRLNEEEQGEEEEGEASLFFVLSYIVTKG